MPSMRVSEETRFSFLPVFYSRLVTALRAGHSDVWLATPSSGGPFFRYRV